MELEFFSAAFLSALFAIVLIDLVLAGDNALIIGLVARNLPKDKQRKVIFWGTFGAIAIRAAMAILVVYVLNLPGFMLARRPRPRLDRAQAADARARRGGQPCRQGAGGDLRRARSAPS